MPITYKPTGTAEAAAKAGKMIGQAEAAKQAQVEALQQARDQMQMQWELAKEQRVREWELEKMEIASRLDFQLQEQKRMQEQTDFDLGLREIRKIEAEGTRPQNVIDKAYADLGKRYPTAKGSASLLGLDAKDDRLSEYNRKPAWADPAVANQPWAIAQRQQELGIVGEARYQEEKAKQSSLGATPTTVSTELPDVAGIRDIVAQIDSVDRILNPITPELKEQAKTIVGKIIVRSPQNKEEIVDLKDWQEYKDKGYIFVSEAKSSQSPRTPQGRYYQGYGGRGI